MSTEFYFTDPQPYLGGRTGSGACVFISPGYYAKNIALALELAEELREKLRISGIEFTDAGNVDVSMWHGCGESNKGFICIRLDIDMPLSAEEAKQALQKAGFSVDLPDIQ